MLCSPLRHFSTERQRRLDITSRICDVMRCEFQCHTPGQFTLTYNVLSKRTELLSTSPEASEQFSCAITL